MGDFKLTKRETDSSTNKGQTTLQTYGGNTVRSVTTTPPGFSESRVQQGTANTTTTRTLGDVRETKTSTGLGRTTTQTEDKGVVLSFRIPIQQRNPIVRTP
jgi:hypothetical protein